MVKFKKIIFGALIWSVFTNDSLSCYGGELKEKINIREFPAYFSTETWEAIKLANDQHNRNAKKIVAIMDSPVKYISGLNEKSNNDIQTLIHNATSIPYPYEDHPYHGTAVAGLIASKPIKLACFSTFSINEKFSSKIACDKSEIVVVGIAQHTKLVNAIIPKNPEWIEEAIKNLMISMDILSNEEKKI